MRRRGAHFKAAQQDAVREVALRLEADKRITWYRAEVESMESIHNHNAFAVVDKV